VKRRISHEREAEELRAGIERLIEVAEPVRNLVRDDADEEVVFASALQLLLDNVDARDSLAFLEKKARRKKPKPAKRRRKRK
jgi:hypothetical protein